MNARQAAFHFILCQAATFHRRRVIRADAVHAAVQCFFTGVHDLHVIAEIGERHGDAAAHRARADHRGCMELARLHIGRQVGQLCDLALGEEGVAQRAGFLGVFQFLEERGLACEPFIERHVARGFHRFDAAVWRLLVACPAGDRLAGGVEDPGIVQRHRAVAHAGQRANIGDAARISDCGGAQVGAFRQHLVENAIGQRLRGGHVAAGGDHVQRDLRAGQPRQALRAATAGEDADLHLRQPDLRGRHRDAVVAGHGVLQPAAQRVAVDGGDHRLLAAVQHVVGAAAERRTLAAGAETANVGAGDEAAARADQHHGADRRIGVGAVECVDDAFGNAGPECVHWRIIHHDDADIACLFQPYHLCFAHDASSLRSRDRRQTTYGGKPHVMGCTPPRPRQANSSAREPARMSISEVKPGAES